MDLSTKHEFYELGYNGFDFSLNSRVVNALDANMILIGATDRICEMKKEFEQDENKDENKDESQDKKTERFQTVTEPYRKAAEWSLQHGACILFGIQQENKWTHKHETFYSKNISMLKGPGDMKKGVPRISI